MKPAAPAALISPDTAPCSCGATDKEAPEVNPARAMPKPNPDNASAVTMTGKECATRNSKFEATATQSPDAVSTRAESPERCTITNCPNSAASAEAINPILDACTVARASSLSTSCRKNPKVWIGIEAIRLSINPKATKGNMRGSYQRKVETGVPRALGAVRSGRKYQIAAALISASAEMK